MQINLLWTGIQYHSLENCIVDVLNTDTEINSTIIGSYEGKIYLVEYCIKTNKDWQTYFVELKYRHSNKEVQLILKKEKDNWLLNNTKANEFKDCFDVDISLSPFTNSLPVNRLKLSNNQEQKIKVIYINILEQELKPVEQVYKRLSKTKYLYQNVPNDFEAEIEVDESGFVVSYPSLFKRRSVLKTFYTGFQISPL